MLNDKEIYYHLQFLKEDKTCIFISKKLDGEEFKNKKIRKKRSII